MLADIFYIFPYLRRSRKTIAEGTDTFNRLSVRPSVRTEQLGSHTADFCEIWYWIFLVDLVDKFEFRFKVGEK